MYLFYLIDTQQANYHVVAAVTYRANGAVSRSCLPQYQDLMSQYYTNLNNILTQRCSAVNVNMNVSFVRSVPYLLEENVLKVWIIMERNLMEIVNRSVINMPICLRWTLSSSSSQLYVSLNYTISVVPR